MTFFAILFATYDYVPRQQDCVDDGEYENVKKVEFYSKVHSVSEYYGYNLLISGISTSAQYSFGVITISILCPLYSL